MKIRTLSSVAITLVLTCALIYPAMAREAASGMASGKRTVDAACVKPAVLAREDAIITAWTTFNTSVSSAYAARKTALGAAWDMTDASARNAAIKAAWNAFNKAKKDAQKKWQTDRKAAWKTFRAAAKACKAPDTDAGGEAMDQ